jgi:hypothetical protein
MIHRSNGDTTGKKDGFILQKEKIGKNRPDTSYSGSPQDRIEHNFEHRNKRGLFPRGFIFPFCHTSSPCLLFMINLLSIILYIKEHISMGTINLSTLGLQVWAINWGKGMIHTWPQKTICLKG